MPVLILVIDRDTALQERTKGCRVERLSKLRVVECFSLTKYCLLYTSDAADE